MPEGLTGVFAGFGESRATSATTFGALELPLLIAYVSALIAVPSDMGLPLGLVVLSPSRMSSWGSSSSSA